MNDKIKNYIFIFALSALTLVSAALMFHRLGDRSLCGDEMEHRRMALQPVSRIMQGWRVQAEPLAHLIKHFSLKICDCPVNLRILGFTGAFLMVLLIGLITGKIAGRWTGITAAFLVMLCPGLMKWGQYDRFYTFGTAAMLLTTLLFFRALEKDNWKSWIWYGVAALMQIQLWYFGMVHLAVCSVAYALLWLLARTPLNKFLTFRPDKWRSLFKVFVIFGSIGALLIIQYFTFNNKILGVVFNPTDNDKFIRYGPSAFSWETFGFVFQMYLPAYVHMKWLLIIGFFAALVMDKERSFTFAFIAVLSTFLIVYGLDKNKATLSENRMLFTVPFWAFFMARGAWLVTDIFWRGGAWLINKFPTKKFAFSILRWGGTAGGIIIALALILPLQAKAWKAFKKYYSVDFTYCRNIGDFLAVNVGTNDSVYYEWSMEGLPIKFYYEKQRGEKPIMHTCKDVNKGGFNISAEDIKLLKEGKNKMWLLPNWRPFQNTMPSELRYWLPKRSITLAIQHPWVPWSGPQKIIIADKKYENFSPAQRELEKIRWLKKFVAVGKYYNDAAAEILSLLLKNNLTNEFSEYLRFVAKRYPDEPKLAKKIAAMEKINDNDLIFAGENFPNCGDLQARLAKLFYNKNNLKTAARYYQIALNLSPNKIYDGKILRDIIKKNNNKNLKTAVLKNLKNKKTTKSLKPNELYEWASASPVLLDEQWLIYPTKDEVRFLKFAVSKNADDKFLRERMKKYNFSKLWEYTEVANVFSHAKKWNLAVEWLEKSINSGLKNWLLAQRLTELYQVRNKPEEKKATVSACEKFKNWLPENELTNLCVAAYKLGMLYASENRNDEAKKLFEETAARAKNCKYHPLHFRAWIQLGNLARKAGNTDEAIIAYENVLKLEPSHKSTIEILANLYDAKNEKDKAAILRKKLK